MTKRTDHHRNRFFFLAITTSLISVSFHAMADPAYTPPPLFVTSSVVVTTPVPAPSEPISLAPPISLDPTENTALVESASLAPRVQNPVQNHAPISADLLLNHPADRIAQNAQDVLNALPVDDATAAGIPDLLPYDLAEGGVKPIKDLSIPTTATRVSKESSLKRLTPRSQKKKPESNLARMNPTRDAVNTHARAAIEPVAMEDLTLDASPEEQETATNAPPPLFNTPLAQISPASGDAKRPTRTAPTTDPFIEFTPQETTLTPMQKDQIAVVLKALPPQGRLEIRAYIPPKTKDGQRLALGRGLAVRQFLKDQGMIPHHLMLRVLAAENATDQNHRVVLHPLNDAGL